MEFAVDDRDFAFENKRLTIEKKQSNMKKIAE